MKSCFDEGQSREAVRRYADLPEELARRVYTSRLIGRDTGLVLHGGGNTSVKLRRKNTVGEEQDVLYVKGSGLDLATIEPDGFVALDIDPLRKLWRVATLSDEEMENELQIHKASVSFYDPSVEALLHVFLPHTYVDHTHADNILILTNQEGGEDVVRDALGPKVAVLPYVKSGFPLARGMIELYESSPEIEAIVVLSHGIFTFGEDARTSYERMIECVTRAEAYINKKTRGKSLLTPRTDLVPPEDVPKSAARFAQVVRGVCAHRGPDGKLRRFQTEFRMGADMMEASLSKQIRNICDSGALTPDHVIRTKNWAVYIESVSENDAELGQLVKESVEAYRKKYDRYFNQQTESKKIKPRKLDPYPRVFVVAGVGLFALGFNRKAARIAADIAEHTVKAKARGIALGGYTALSDAHMFDMEYWRPQQKKLDRSMPLPLEGQVALLTGGAGAMGFGIADRLLAAGAAVAISDVDEGRLRRVHSILTERYGESQIESIPFDVKNYQSVEAGFEEISRRLGGIDIVVPNAGIAHVAKIEDLHPKTFDQVIAVNLKGTFNVIRASVPVFRRQGTGGNIVVISSKNVFDPGAAFSAYSASKAGAHQVSKIAALELAELGVRVNMINPDAVFGDERVSSKLWELVGAERMKSRGLDPEGLREYYRQRSLLKVPVLAEHVGNAVVFFASEQTPTTGATLPIDGGIPAAFPR